MNTIASQVTSLIALLLQNTQNLERLRREHVTGTRDLMAQRFAEVIAPRLQPTK